MIGWGAGGALLGAVAGSFLATLVLRWPAGRSIASGRSACDGCGRTLRAWELVPLLSVIALRGRCHRCGAAIDPLHGRVELAGAVIGMVALAIVPGWDGAAGALFGWMLLALAILDWRHHWLPDLLTLPLLLIGLLAGAAGIEPTIAARIGGVIAGYAALVSIAALYRWVRGRQGLGGGDPKLLAAIGAWLGWQDLPFVVLAAALIGLAGVAAAAIGGRKVSATDRLPLGTLLAIAAWGAWVGSQL